MNKNQPWWWRATVIDNAILNHVKSIDSIFSGTILYSDLYLSGQAASPSGYSYNIGNFKTKAHYLLAWYTENKALWYLDTNSCLLIYAL